MQYIYVIQHATHRVILNSMLPQSHWHNVINGMTQKWEKMGYYCCVCDGSVDRLPESSLECVVIKQCEILLYLKRVKYLLSSLSYIENVQKSYVMYFGLFRTTISMISVSPTLHSKILGGKNLTDFSLPGKSGHSCFSYLILPPL